MASWGEFARAAPDLATWGQKRFNRSHVAYLATLRADGAPGIHPVTPVICQDNLFLFVDPDSPASANLRHNDRCALHSLIDNPSGIGGEFRLQGRAKPISDGDTRTRASAAACYSPPEGYLLFQLDVEAAYSTDYEEGQPTKHCWELAAV
ncbi:MAG: pyridoxamine 5'-phosphate oxidase [Chloroflexi bacterium]|nr:pyridoxamine 5'-phosphate oxidase [Chloroflexota bacterium]